MSRATRVLSRREAYDHGWTIAPLSYYITQRFEEAYEDPSPEEVIRRIALTQDDYALWSTRRYLKTVLIARLPQRRYSTQVDQAIDDVLHTFYFGENMSTALSLAQQKQLERQAAERRERLTAIILDVNQETQGIPVNELPTFIESIIRPKYFDGLSQEEIDIVLHDIGPSEPLGFVPQPLAAAMPKLDNQLHPWTAKFIKNFYTNILEIALVSSAPGHKEIQIRRKDEANGYFLQIKTGNAITAGEHAILANLINEEYIPRLLDVINKNFD